MLAYLVLWLAVVFGMWGFTYLVYLLMGGES